MQRLGQNTIFREVFADVSRTSAWHAEGTGGATGRAATVTIPTKKKVAVEASRRNMLKTIEGSWRSVRSALVAWGVFCESFSFQHFPISRESARNFCYYLWPMAQSLENTSST